MGEAVPFPATQPRGYEWLDGEPAFDAGRHLQLEEPAEVLMLADLGYDAAEIATKATPVALSSPFRMLSDEGSAIVLETARRLRCFTRPAGERIERTVRGGCYRSRWLRDLCLSPEVTAHLTSDLIGIDDPETLWTEWAKFAAWRSKDRLAHLIDELEFTSDRDTVITQLESAIDDAQRAIAEMRAGEQGLLHYGD